MTAMRWADRPMLHFLLIGGVLFVISRWIPASRPPVVVSGADIARRSAEWAWQHGEQPDVSTRRVIEEEALDDAVLHQSAVDTGVDGSDTRLRERLLGFPRAEEVQRRHVTQLMLLAAGRLGPSDLPSEAELAAYLGAHPDAFAEPATLSLTHVYFAADQRGPELARDALAAAERVRRGAISPEEAAALGDAFLAGATVHGASGSELERIFGPEFTAAVWDAPPGTWIGPVPSTYGQHLVWIRERVPGRLPSLEAVRSRVLQAMLYERRAVRRAERVRALRQLYSARVDDSDPMK
ncbi:MAG TPA: peptidylprolyl isomerase [Candidatus Binatia bacterium]|nr:peptidylprolyl isomerase [Candidatus Binatia bacterium]